MLEHATKERLIGAPVMTFMADQGLGKTSLASLFPKPFFIWVEDGSKAIPKSSQASWLPNESGTGPLVCKSSKEVLEQIQALGREKHDFKTLVIDSITQLNTIIEDEIIKRDPKKPQGINQALGGYGNGLAAAACTHKTIRDFCELLKERRGMTIIFVAHTDTETVTLPDDEPFTKYTLRMNKRSVAHYSDNVDLVAHIKHKIFYAGDDGKRAITGGRLIVAHSNPASIAKNRYGIKEEMEFEEGENPLLEHIGKKSTTTKEAK